MKIERITSLESLDKLKEKWDKFLFSSEQNSIFLTFEWFSSWWKSFSDDNSLEILIFKDGNEKISGFAPFMSKNNTLQFIASQEVSDYCDFVMRKEREREFYECLLNYLKINYSGLEKINLINIKQSSPALVFLPQLAEKYGFILDCNEIEVAPFLALPSSYESYLKQLNSKNRHELRRKLKRMDALKEIKIQRIKDTQNLQRYADDFIVLHQKSSPVKAKFWQKKGMTDFFHEFIYLFSLRNWVELNLLIFEDKIIAALLNFSYFDRVYFYNSAYDREYSSYSPGLFLFHDSLKQAIQEQKKEADFLRGNERYKYNLGAKDNKVFQIVLRN